MTIQRASCLGFCQGVRSALKKALDAREMALGLSLDVYIYGSIVHNSRVQEDFSRLGIRTISSAYGQKPGVVVIRAHGIADSERKAFEDLGYVIVDATCPVVLHNQALLRSASDPLIIGSSMHDEVIALRGVAVNACVIERPEDLSMLSRDVEYSAVIQTTLSSSLLDEIKHVAVEKGLTINYLNSICNASLSRREAVRDLASVVDAVVVVGDRTSANARQLERLASSSGKMAYLVESGDELPDEVFCYGRIGITSGASTPDSQLEDVEKALEEGYARRNR